MKVLPWVLNLALLGTAAMSLYESFTATTDTEGHVLLFIVGVLFLGSGGYFSWYTIKKR